MATVRCYTKSGSKEKYESNLWKSPTSGNWSSMGIIGSISTPDSNGNYTVTPGNNFKDSDSTTSYYCFTEYNGIKKTFYFEKSIVMVSIHVNIQVIGYRDYAGNVVFNCTISSDNDAITTNILKNNSITLSYSVVTAAGPVGSYSARVTSDMTLLAPGIRYVEGKTYYINSDHSCSPSSGTYGEYNTWNIVSITGT